MAEPKSGIRIYSLDEANSVLPRVRKDLSRLRVLRRQIVSRQALVDVEEISASGHISPESRKRIESFLAEIERDVHSFHKASEELHSLGCELKDLDKGLVDFYGMRGNEVVYLCWMDGEEAVTHWHPLDSGFKGRQPID